MTKHQIHFLLSFILLLCLLAATIIFRVSFWWISIFLFVQIVIFIYGITNLQFNYFFESKSNIKTTQKRIALTFDDGPTPITLEILELLKKNNAKATFFCVGKNIETHLDILKKIDKQGHTIGNHTYNHALNFDFLSTQNVLDELNKCSKVIEKEIQKKPLLFRPPNGVSNPMIAKALKQIELQSIAWNIRTFDTFYRNEDKIFNRIIKQFKPGSIILMHDKMPHTVNLVSKLLNYLKKENFELVTVDELLNLKAYE